MAALVAASYDYSSVLYLRNNLTGLAAVPVRGRGGSAVLRATAKRAPTTATVTATAAQASKGGSAGDGDGVAHADEWTVDFRCGARHAHKCSLFANLN